MATAKVVSATVEDTVGSMPLEGDYVTIAHTSGPCTAYFDFASSMTVNSGFPLRPGQTIQFPLDEPQTIYFVQHCGGAARSFLRVITYEESS